MNPFARLFSSVFPTPAQRELTALERQLKSAQRRLQESYDDLDSRVYSWEREREELMRGAALTGRRSGRKDGDGWPFLRMMEDLTDMRAESRLACEGNGYGAGVLDRAVDFVIGDGMQTEVTLMGARKGAVSTGVADADGDGRPDSDPAVENVQRFIDDFRRLNDWGMGEEDREEEGFRRSQRDAEVGVRFFEGGGKSNGVPVVRWFEPEQLDSPPNALPHERWGIRTDPKDVETKEAYYLYGMDGVEGEWVDASEIVFHKLGTDRTVLRGMPQFWLVAKALNQCEALNSAVSEVSAIQARIAYVREHAAGILPNQITEFVGGQGDATTRKLTPYGDKYRRVGITEEGSTVDMSSGTKFTAGPVSTGVPGFVQALQSRLRQVCARFGYPEFFTGDASNGNYASLLAANGPAERNFKRRQMKYAAFQAVVFRRACEYGVRAGRLSAGDLAAVEIKVKPGGVAVSNKLEEAQIMQIEIQNKTLSVQSAMAERGRDARVEMANIEAFDAKFGAGAMGMGGFGGGQDQGQDPFGGGFGESVKREVGPPPFEGAVFDRAKSRWVKPADAADGVRQRRLADLDARAAAIPVTDDTTPADGSWYQGAEGRQYNFRTSSGAEYSVVLSEPGLLDDDRTPYSLLEFGDADGSHDVTGAGGAKEVLGHVAAATVAVVRATRPPVVTFQAVEPSRQKLYDRLASTLGAAVPEYQLMAADTRAGGRMYVFATPEHAAAARVLLGKSATARESSGRPVWLPPFDPSWLAPESYTQDDYELLSEAARAGLVLQQVGTHPKTGNPIMRYVRAEPKGGAAARKAAERAESLAAARRLIDKGVTGKAQAKILAAHLSNLTVKDIEGLKAAHAAKLGGRLKADKVQTLVAFAQGRGSVQRQAVPTPAPAPVAPAPVATAAPTTPELESAVMGQVRKGLAGKHAPIRMVPIHEIRNTLKAQFPGMTDEQFNEVMLDLRQAKRVRLIPISDRSKATPDQLGDSIPSSVGTLFYVEMP